MAVYEDEIRKQVESQKDMPEKMDIPMLRYFWQASPLASSRQENIPKFLKNIDVLKNFSDNELRILTKFLHTRSFDDHESIFKQGSIGVGFYLVLAGSVDIIVERNHLEPSSKQVEKGTTLVLSLEKHDYFGELALLQERSIRNATARSKEGCQVLGIFKPDVEQMINEYPVVGAKLLQAISMIVANRLFSVTREARILKQIIKTLKSENEQLKK